MIELILELRGVKTTVKTADGEIAPILERIDLKIRARNFTTIIGTDRADKSTLLSIIAGSSRPDGGFLLHDGLDVTKMSEEKWTQLIRCVFQDPKLGAAPKMTVTENLLLATKRSKRRFLRIRKLEQNLPHSKKLAAVTDNGLGNRSSTFAGGLSGDQRRALSFLMATIERSDILLLNKHTATLDPHIGENLLTVTDQQVKENKLTVLIITHHMGDTLKYGSRLLVLEDGKVRADISGREKRDLEVGDLYKCFED